MNQFIGRTKELQVLQSIAQSSRSEFVAVFGRRRVGKTMLIREAFHGKFSFQLTAIANATKMQQLINFHTALARLGSSAEHLPVPENWFTAFQQLTAFLEKSKADRKVVFLDELPWFDTAKSDFIQSLEHFWNSWAASRSDITLVVCGSAASWMIHELINNRGGLHNRVTTKIRLEPFTLKEAEAMLRQKNQAIDRYQIIQFYMVSGGVPFYLDTFSGELSAMQNIENVCFAKDGLLRTEFDNLFRALFAKAERHTAVVEAIASKSKGLTRQEILTATALPNNGNTTRLLQELEESGFIRKYIPFQKTSRDSLYQLIDFYTLFYLKFIRGAQLYDENNWLNALESPGYRAWSGYAFEQICLCHVPQIKQALGISGMVSQTSSWRSHSRENGAQVDLLIDRRDHVINLCEIKFSLQPFTITKAYAAQLQQKISRFKTETDTKKAVWLTMITTFGLTKNEYAASLVQKELTMEVLFG